ncbi:unnamed protein product [Euphydryas editha]|uniref:Major facilitator superfamily (MFS) profile domain-containing protein n=1 Tax=Euphydryas editha TaxID=104508 RepID=A0AAU9T9P5_EUPED|nr:unnamed protein product [Euphydryas editha]
MISSLQKKEDGINLSDNEISMIMSTNTIVSVVGYCLAAVVNDKVGRKYNFIIFSIPNTINWIILYFADKMSTFLISRILGGIALGALMMLYVAATSEYSSPKTRGLFMHMITTVAPAFGTGLGHILGIILHWRTVALIGIIITSFGLIAPYFWVESPHWLATQGRFDESQKAFRKLNVMNPESENELRVLIKMENSKLDKAIETNSKSTFKRFLLALKRKYFWDLLLVTIVMFMYLTAAGKIIFSLLAIVLLKEITGSSDVLLFTLSVDSCMIIGSVLSCILIRRTSMRFLLFSTGFTSNTVLFLLSLCLYLKNDTAYSQWLNVSLLALYFTLLNAGPYPIFEALSGEIFPIDLKLYFLLVTYFIAICLLFLSIILLPYMTNLVGYHGYFLINAMIMTVCLVFLWWKLPETKGKTLQEIEVYFKVKDFDVDKAFDNEQIKTLI